VRGEVGSPVVDTAAFTDFNALKSSRNKKTMKNLRNSINRLTKAGEHSHTAAIGGAGVAPIVAATLRRRMAWMESRGLTAPQFRSAAHEAILVGGESWGLDKMRAGFELQSNGQPIAHQWGFVHQGRYYAYMSATDPSAVLLSPGRLHLAYVIDDAMRHGIRAVEMLTPASDYKMVWTAAGYGFAAIVFGTSARFDLGPLRAPDDERAFLRSAIGTAPPDHNIRRERND
jgi:CelD/BcsL family acetyltransferase involved in cellulose biosynthesis